MPFPCFHFPQTEANLLLKSCNCHPHKAIEIGQLPEKAVRNKLLPHQIAIGLHGLRGLHHLILDHHLLT